MAHLRNKRSLYAKLTGCSPGNDITLKQVGGKIIVTKKADMSNVEYSPAQKDGQSFFARAQAVVNAYMADKAKYEAFAKTCKKKNGRPCDQLKRKIFAELKAKEALAAHTLAPGIG